ncbi:MAG: hypothetical protein ACLTGT_00440 [Oscillospiraceae bacterium]
MGSWEREMVSSSGRPSSSARARPSPLGRTLLERLVSPAASSASTAALYCTSCCTVSRSSALAIQMLDTSSATAR